MKCRVAVLMGGMSAEREVSLQTGRAIAEALGRLGHEAVEVDVTTDIGRLLADAQPDCAFMALHGRGGEDGSVQGLLELMRIPYTGCGVLACALTMDKVMTKKVLRSEGIPVVDDVVARRSDPPGETAARIEEFGYPVMVKPASEGSSIATAEVRGATGLGAALSDVFACDDRALIEKFIDGRLLTVGLLGPGPTAFPVLEIKPKEGFYDYRNKYEAGRTIYEVPADLTETEAAVATRLSVESFLATGCEEIARVDLMMEAESGRILVLEVNTIPGMTETSLYPKGAAALGIGFDELVGRLLDGARLKVEFGA